MTTAVKFENVSRHFGAIRAVDGVTLEIADGEFFSMLGPSGSGKTTCLRLIAGFETPSAGRIAIHGADMAGVPPYDRDINTVFQDYALFPHMSVLDNVAYGLMVRKLPKGERHARAEEMLDMVKLANLGGRRPAELSGGQRQRVALARALINHPRVLLLDEPLGALDLKLREQMQVELKGLQRKIGITFVYVTHDQQEALGMSDRLAVFNEGKIEQIGPPQEIYEHPATAFVAGFVGNSNLVDAAAAELIAGMTGAQSIRPEKIHFAADYAGAQEVVKAGGVVLEVQYLGAATRYEIETDAGAVLFVLRQNVATGGQQGDPAVGDRIELAWERNAMQSLSGGTAGE
jgi:putative spermidine/putrescine transport system ATP-binding protein